MNHSKKEIAAAFSNGDFELTYPYLSESIEWNIVGESCLSGKAQVIEHCNRTTQYFKSIQTNFQTGDVLEANNKVVIRGTGEFLKDGIRVNLIAACDVYEFDQNGKLERISSYCIPEKQQTKSG